MCRRQKITQVNCPDKDRVAPESTPGVPSISLGATDRKDGTDLSAHKLLNLRMPYDGMRGRDKARLSPHKSLLPDWAGIFRMHPRR